MISLTIWFCLWSSSFVLAPPSWNINQGQSLGNRTSIPLNSSNLNSKLFVRRRKLTINPTTTVASSQQFDLNSYRSSWKFVDKNTIRVRFRLYETLLYSVTSARFLVRHTNTDHIQTYNEPHETINSTLNLYLRNIKHGRHTVCLLLYTTKLKRNPRHIFCQDIIFNFQKYGHHDIDSDEYGNTFVFLLTQYAIVLGILCLLQLVHAGRKRRFLATVYDKANALRNLVMEHHRSSQENKSTTDINPRSHALEYLIYNLNQNALENFDQMYVPTSHDDDVNDKFIDHSTLSNRQRRTKYDRHLKLPNRFDEHAKTSLVGRRRSVTTTNDNFDESDFETQSYGEQSASFKSVSHILEANKPWMTRLSDNGSIKHSILSSIPMQSTRVETL